MPLPNRGVETTNGNLPLAPFLGNPQPRQPLLAADNTYPEPNKLYLCSGRVGQAGSQSRFAGSPPRADRETSEFGRGGGEHARNCGRERSPSHTLPAPRAGDSAFDGAP